MLRGGEGADTFEFLTDGAEGPIRILLANVANLTAENFADFDPRMLNVPGRFNWSEMDAVILDADAGDRILMDGVEQGVSESVHSVVNVSYDEDEEWHSENIDAVVFLSDAPEPGYGERIVDTYGVEFLAPTPLEVFAGAAGYTHRSFFEFADEDVRALQRERFGPMSWDGVHAPESAKRTGSLDCAQDGVPGRTCYVELRTVSAYLDGYGSDGTTARSTDGRGPFTSSQAMGSWFILGSRFDGTTLIADGTFSATMPDLALIWPSSAVLARIALFAWPARE